MKAHLDWHHSSLGRFLLFIGGLRLAIPVMALVSVAMIWGTYLDATQGAKVAARLVYGSGWFIGLMALVCVSLIAAVITRYPWNRRHVGFITVHTGLVILIVGGFWSLFGRLEGRMVLQEGQSSSEIEINTQRLELVEFNAGVSRVLASTSAEDHISGSVRLGGMKVEILERWGNTREEAFVADDGPEPLRAFEITMDRSATHGMWIAEAGKSGGPAVLGGLTIRVLGVDEQFTPPSRSSDETGFGFVVAGQRYPLGAEGDEAFPGWTIRSITRYASAIVKSGGIGENPEGGDNPAVDVVIASSTGTVERHTAFEKFPDMVLSRTMEGSGSSGAALRAAGGSAEELVIYGAPDALRASYVDAGGVVTSVEHSGVLPWHFDAGGRHFWILSQVTRARQASRFVEAPPASEYRPALVVRTDGAEPEVLPWKGTARVPGKNALLRFGPRREPVPFSVRLEEFRKTDYPGTMMAMAYESDVVVTTPDHQTESLTVFMNNPYAYGDWKVYQSGFVGDTVSVFSVMKDPGLPMTYAGCTILCVGILVTFYSRMLSRGHPGIRPAKEAKESFDVAAYLRDVGGDAGAGGDAGPGGRALAGDHAGDPDPGRGADQAARLVRSGPGG